MRMSRSRDPHINRAGAPGAGVHRCRDPRQVDRIACCYPAGHAAPRECDHHRLRAPSSGPTSTRRSRRSSGCPDDDGDNKVVPVDPAAQGLRLPLWEPCRPAAPAASSGAMGPSPMPALDPTPARAAAALERRELARACRQPLRRLEVLVVEVAGKAAIPPGVAPCGGTSPSA